MTAGLAAGVGTQAIDVHPAYEPQKSSLQPAKCSRHVYLQVDGLEGIVSASANTLTSIPICRSCQGRLPLQDGRASTKTPFIQASVGLSNIVEPSAERFTACTCFLPFPIG